MIVVRRARTRDHPGRYAELDEMYRSLLPGHGAVGGGNRRAWRPPLEVIESPDALEVIAEIAGMKGDEIEVTIADDILSLRGTRQDALACEHRTYHEARIAYGPFAADIHIPFAVDAESASASYENGFLRIRLPRAKGRTIVPTRVGSRRAKPEE